MDREKIIHTVSENSNFILVSNYKARKEISHDGFRSIDSINILKDRYTIGMWIVKHKKQ